MRRLGLMMLFVAAIARRASAQETTGTITGVASDQTGARAAGRDGHDQEHQHRPARTRRHQRDRPLHRAAAAGRRLRSHVRALSGFQPVTLKDIELHVNDRLKLDGKLSVGGVAESVEVTAGSAAGAADRRRCRRR